MRRILITALVLAALPTAATAEQHIYSYDPANDRTRAYVDNGLTFVFDKSLISFRVKEVLATQANAAAKVDPADERDLGVRLDKVLPAGAPEREIYRIKDSDQGPAMVRAFCPGSTKGWLVFGPLKARKDLTVHVLGNDAASGKARLCASLALTYHGEWTVPVERPSATLGGPPPVASPF